MDMMIAAISGLKEGAAYPEHPFWTRVLWIARLSSTLSRIAR